MKKIIKHLLNIIKKILKFLNPANLLAVTKNFIKNIPLYIKNIRRGFYEVISFTVLFTIFLFNHVVVSFLRLSILPPKVKMMILGINRKLGVFVARFDKSTDGLTRMNRLELFELAFRNMTFKKSRTIITIGGMALGVGAIVFLVSIGYGLEALVKSRVARLDELRQADVSVQPGSNVKLTDESLRDFREIQDVDSVLPLIGLVAKVNYQGSNSDVAVYGVTTQYLKTSAIQPIDGKLFDNDKIGLLTPKNFVTKIETSSDRIRLDVLDGQVAGARVVSDDVSIGQKVQDVKFTIFPRSWLAVREGPTTASRIIGYTRKVEGVQYGEEYWGGSFLPEERGRILQNEDGAWFGKWIKTKVYLWEEKSCEYEDPKCENEKYYPIENDEETQTQAYGYIAELELLVESASFDPNKPSVLGIKRGNVLADTDTATDALTDTTGSEETTSSTDLNSEDQDYIDLILQSTGSAGLLETKKVQLPPDTQREAVVNQALLKVLGLDGTNPVEKTFDVSYVVTSNLLENETSKVESEPVPYKIVGVIPGDNTPFFYVPLSDMKTLGITSYSQVKIISTEKEKLQEVRDKINVLGFVTSSVADTVNQIERLFSTLRFVLGILGGVALGVASLGMFNTLTVSLLERTREVGLMKAMGMTSGEVKRLFLTESLLMGFLGGILGILFGYGVGKFLSLGLSFLGVVKGVGFIDVTHIPFTFVTLVFSLSLFVGLVTGVYPSKRATKISALNALRYE